MTTATGRNKSEYDSTRTMVYNCFGESVGTASHAERAIKLSAMAGKVSMAEWYRAYWCDYAANIALEDSEMQLWLRENGLIDKAMIAAHLNAAA